MKHFNTWKDENNDCYAGTPNSSVVQFGFWLWQQNVSHWASHKQLIACLGVSIAFLHAEMKDEVYIKMDADTLRLKREENLPNLQTFDDEGFYKADTAL